MRSIVTMCDNVSLIITTIITNNTANSEIDGSWLRL